MEVCIGGFYTLLCIVGGVDDVVVVYALQKGCR